MTDAIFTQNTAFTLPTTTRLLLTAEIFLNIYKHQSTPASASAFIPFIFPPFLKKKLFHVIVMIFSSEVHPRLRVRLGIRLGLEILAWSLD